MKKAQSSLFADMWEFNWPLMDVLIGGHSSIDLQSLGITTKSEAHKFIETYGYELQSRDDRRQLHAVMIEALSFIERYLMPEEWVGGLVPPDDVMLCSDPTELLLWASTDTKKDLERKVWSCAVLRVMHTIAHLDGIRETADTEQAREQIMARFQRHVMRDMDGSLWFGSGEFRIHLEKIDWKTEKSRESILLKLLHKPGNVAETIYDMVGVRIITRRFCDVLIVVKFLEDFHIVSFPNCIPSRARNSLIDVNRFRKILDGLRVKVRKGTLSPEEFAKQVERLAMAPGEGKRSNPHSGASYRAIQLTARQRIRGTNPAYGWVGRLAEAAKQGGTIAKAAAEISKAVGSWEEVRRHRDFAAFYPFEIQVMDSKAYRQSGTGAARHDRYKQSQIRTARQRVLSEILALQE